MKNKIIFILLFILLLTGCKSREMEDRDFVMVIAVDKNERCNLYADIAELNNNSDSLEIKNNIVSAEGNTINNALNKINKETSGELYLGHVQTILVTNENCKSEIKNLVRNNNEIGRDIPVVKCSEIQTVLDNENDNIKLHEYISKYFDNNKHKKINIESYLNENENNTTLPVITVKNDKYYIE